MARPSKYNEIIATEICDRIADGQSMRFIGEDAEMPTRRTMMRWLDEHEGFVTKYARAREAQADVMDELILSVADECTPQTAAADRVKIDAYKWRASKLMPKRYGDRMEQVVTATVNHTSDISDDQLEAIATGSRNRAPGKAKGSSVTD